MTVRVRQPCLEKFLVNISKDKLDATKHNDSIRNVLFITSVCDKARQRLRNGLRSRSLEDLDGEGRMFRTRRATIKRVSPMSQECKVRKASACADEQADDIERPRKRMRIFENDDRTVPDEEKECDGGGSSDSSTEIETDSDATMDDDSEPSTSEDEMELSAVLSGLMDADRSASLTETSVA